MKEVSKLLMTTSDTIEGYKIVKSLGIVRGNTIRAKHIGKDIIAGLRNIVGGEIKEYTEMLNEAREESLKRMKEDAEKVGAVVTVRFTTSTVIGGAAELLVYGTAVKLKK
jgi:uncharacterized protein YbjQ (UPF0145 family)